MVSSGYGTEATFESIFAVPAADVDATRFAAMNVYIGTQFNFYITADANTDIANTAVTPMLASTTHFLIWELYLLSKASLTVQPWDAAMAAMNQIDFYKRYYRLIKTCQDILYGRMEMSTSNLPGTNSRSY